MRVFSRYWLPLACTLTILSACGVTGFPLRTERPQDNKTYEIDYLFEHEGVKVYRFRDYGNFVYFTTRGDITSISEDSTRIQTITIDKDSIQYKDR